jgi:hypothetical protein
MEGNLIFYSRFFWANPSFKGIVYLDQHHGTSINLGNKAQEVAESYSLENNR